MAKRRKAHNTTEWKLGAGLRSVMGGSEYCSKEELTHDILLGYLYLLARSELVEVETLEVEL